jgi:hypothetical protein
VTAAALRCNQTQTAHGRRASPSCISPSFPETKPCPHTHTHIHTHTLQQQTCTSSSPPLSLITHRRLTSSSHTSHRFRLGQHREQQRSPLHPRRCCCCSSCTIMPAPTVLQQSQLRAVIPRNKVSSAAGSAIASNSPCTACKCQICTCGGHKCRLDKVVTTHYDPQYLQTTSASDYNRKHAAPAVSAAPKHVYDPSGVKFSGVSTYSSDHSGHAGSPATPFVPSHNVDTIHPNNDRFFDSEMRSEYGPKGYNKRDGFKPKNAIPAAQPFDGHTSNREDFKNWEGAKPATPFKAKNELTASPENRDFRSESSLHYVSHPYSKSAAFVPAQGVANTAKFDAQSSHSSDYQSYTFAPCPAAPLSDNTLKLATGHQIYNQTPRGGWATIA